MCLYVTSVKLSDSWAKVNSPALGQGWWRPRCFPQEPRDPRRLLAGARGGLREEDDPLSCPPEEHTSAGLSFFFLLSPSFTLFSFYGCFTFCICVRRFQYYVLDTLVIITLTCSSSIHIIPLWSESYSPLYFRHICCFTAEDYISMTVEANHFTYVYIFTMLLSYLCGTDGFPLRTFYSR